MLMFTEKEVLMSLANDTVIDNIAETSALLRRLLMPLLCRPKRDETIIRKLYCGEKNLADNSAILILFFNRV